MTNREAWHKGYVDGFKGLNPRPDYPKIGLAGSYRLGYEAGEKRRKEPKGPKLSKRKNPTVAGLKNELRENDSIIADLETDPFYGETPGRRAYRSKWLLHYRRQRRQLEALLRQAEKLALRRVNGIVEAAAGLQALDYFSSKAKRVGLGKKPKFNPRDDRFLIQVHKASGGREQFYTNREAEAKTIAASWFSRGASVTIVDRKKKTQTVYGKKNPAKTLAQKRAIIKALRHHTSEHLREVARLNDDPDIKATAKAILTKRTKRSPSSKDHAKNPRTKGSRDALGVFYAENPIRELLANRYVVTGTQRRVRFYLKPDKLATGFLEYAEVFNGPDSAERAARKENNSKVWGFRWVVKRITKSIKLNPSVTDLSRTFQGEADGSIDRLYAADGAPANIARAGKLVFLKVNGKTFRLPGAMVGIAPNGKLWLTGSGALFETKARKGEGLDVGEVSHICYETAKAHIGDGKIFEYVHEFGEEGGKRPHLIIDHEGMPILRGGDYKIRAEGIVN